MCVCVFARLCQQAHQIYHRYQEKCPALAARDSFANFSSSSCGCFSTIELQSSRSIKISRPHDTSLVPATITLFMLLKPSDNNIHVHMYSINIYIYNKEISYGSNLNTMLHTDRPVLNFSIRFSVLFLQQYRNALTHSETKTTWTLMYSCT